MNRWHPDLEILLPFARYFSRSRATRSDKLPGLDPQRELLSQLAKSTWLDANLANHSGLHPGCPISNDRRELTADCLMWCPQGWPNGHFVSIASSRLGDRLFSDSNITDAIRNFFVLLEDTDVVVVGQGTTLELPATRGCQLFGKTRLRLTPFPKSVSRSWIETTIAESPYDQTTIYFDSNLMSVDELTFALSDHVRVVHARINGNIDRLVKRYELAAGPGPVIMKLVDRAASPRGKKLSVDKGTVSVSWYLCPRDAKSEPNSITSTGWQAIELGDWTAEFLNHWTRADRHPWPDQTSLSQFDAMFLGHDSQQGALQTLCRILVQQRLLGSGRLVRGGQRVVCFTEVPLQYFRDRRIFRPQLSRWDFEPWGISIRRSVIERLGGQPVQYVSREGARQAGTNLARLQVINPADSKVDWSQEREWRVTGDLDLRCVGSDDAVVFVPDQKAAAIVGKLSRWPIVVLPEQGQNSAESRYGVPPNCPNGS